MKLILSILCCLHFSAVHMTLENGDYCPWCEQPGIPGWLYIVSPIWGQLKLSGKSSLGFKQSPSLHVTSHSLMQYNAATASPRVLLTCISGLSLWWRVVSCVHRGPLLRHCVLLLASRRRTGNRDNISRELEHKQDRVYYVQGFLWLDSDVVMSW